MNVSLAIPQLFYDFIARVLPGFLFLFALRVCLAGTVFEPGWVITVQSGTAAGDVLQALEFLLLCYFAGWFLSSLRLPKFLWSKKSKEGR